MYLMIIYYRINLLLQKIVNMLIAITGSNGFIGDYLCKYLINFGYKIRRIQREKEKNAFLINDLKKNNDWRRVLSGVDIVIHCASKVHSFQNLKKANADYESINVLATERIAKEAASLNIKKLIFLSSVKVYGEKTFDKYPFDNNTQFDPKDEYSKSKCRAENVLREVSKKYGLKIIIIRIPLVYGPLVGANFLNFIKLVNLNIPLPFGNIKNKRSIIYIGNLADFISKCIVSKDALNKSFVVSDSNPVSTVDLVRYVAKGLNKKIIIFKLPLKILKLFGLFTNTKNKINRLIESLEVDPSETFKCINWVPPYSTQEGIDLTTNWFKTKKIKKISQK